MILLGGVSDFSRYLKKTTIRVTEAQKREVEIALPFTPLSRAFATFAKIAIEQVAKGDQLSLEDPLGGEEEGEGISTFSINPQSVGLTEADLSAFFEKRLELRACHVTVLYRVLIWSGFQYYRREIEKERAERAQEKKGEGEGGEKVEGGEDLADLSRD